MPFNQSTLGQYLRKEKHRECEGIVCVSLFLSKWSPKKSEWALEENSGTACHAPSYHHIKYHNKNTHFSIIKAASTVSSE